MTELQKFSLDDARKMLRAGEVYAMHISWFDPTMNGGISSLESDYPDCGYVLLIHGMHHRNPKALFGLVIADGDELSYNDKIGLVPRETDKDTDISLVLQPSKDKEDDNAY